MSNRFFSEPITRCRMRRTWGWTVVTVLAFVLGSLVLGWLLAGCSREPGWQSLEAGRGSLNHALSSGEHPAIVPAWVSGSVMGVLFFSAALIFLAVRKARENDLFCEELRERSLTAKRERLQQRREAALDVFAPLRAPGEPVPPEDVTRILVACAAEARCIGKHVRRAQMTLSVEDYGDELRLAERKIDGVIRCVEALVLRLAERDEKGRKNSVAAPISTFWKGGDAS